VDLALEVVNVSKLPQQVLHPRALFLIAKCFFDRGRDRDILRVLLNEEFFFHRVLP
jgi:hypothetical protein